VLGQRYQKSKWLDGLSIHNDFTFQSTNFIEKLKKAKIGAWIIMPPDIRLQNYHYNNRLYPILEMKLPPLIPVYFVLFAFQKP